MKNGAKISMEEPQMLISGNSNQKNEALGDLMLRSDEGCVFEMLSDAIIFERLVSPSCLVF